jgi:DNA-binding MarR family transcriptional regulator
MFEERARALENDLDGVEGSVRVRVVLFRILLALGGQLRARMDRRYREAGITTQQAALLGIAAATDPPPSPSDVARMLGVTHQNVKQFTDALVKKGLLVVRAHPGDRRCKQLIPTARAAPLFARRNPDDFAAITRWLSVLDDREAEELLTMLGRLLAANIEGHDE